MSEQHSSPDDDKTQPSRPKNAATSNAQASRAPSNKALEQKLYRLIKNNKDSDASVQVSDETILLRVPASEPHQDLMRQVTANADGRDLRVLVGCSDLGSAR